MNDQSSDDKLSQAVEALRLNPAMTDEEMAQVLGLLRPASARFWRLKATDILANTPYQPTQQQKVRSSMSDTILPEDFEEQFGENPAAAYGQGLMSAIEQKKRDHRFANGVANAFQEVADDMEQRRELRREQEERKRREPGFFSRLGSLFTGGSSASRPAYYAESEPSTDKLAVPDPESETSRQLSRMTTSAMTPEQLRIRRMNMIESAKFGRPAHENFMLWLLKFWLFVGPIAFVALTTSEVAYILTSLVPPGDTADIVITGGALFIDIAMMFVTFGVAIKRRDLSEKRESGGIVSKREEAETWLGTGMWLLFATINIISQTAFLLHILSLSPNPNMGIMYVFVASRVAGFILGDASTAFFLAKVDGGHLKLIARGEREKGAIYREIAQAEGERNMIEAEADSKIQLLQIKVQQEREDAQFLAELKRQVFRDILDRRMQSPQPAAQPEQPNKARIYKG